MFIGAGNTDYLLDNADPRAELRFDALGDLFDARTIEYLAAIRVALAFKRLLQDRDADLAYARRLPDLLRARGLRDVAGEGRIVFGVGGSPASRLVAANHSQVAEEMIGQNLCTSGELRSTLELLADPSSASQRTC